MMNSELFNYERAEKILRHGKSGQLKCRFMRNNFYFAMAHGTANEIPYSNRKPDSKNIHNYK